MNRRHCLQVVCAASAALPWRLAQAHAGPVQPPLLAPDLPLVDHLGRPRRLRTWINGQVTLVQTIFTGCRSVCPVQGAHFADLQRRLAGESTRLPVRLLSVSIDPLGDTPGALKAWLARMQAREGWEAAVPSLADVDALRAALDAGPGVSSADLESHSDKVYVFDSQARLRWRSTSLPPANVLIQVAKQIAA